MDDRGSELADLGPAGLTRLLAERADVRAQPVPRTLSELAQRLDSPVSVQRALDLVTVPELQVLSAAVTLGHEIEVRGLTDLLGGDPRPQLTRLTELGLVGPVVRGRFTYPPVVRQVMPDLLGLGIPFAVLAAGFPHRVLQTAEKAFGQRPSSAKWASAAALELAYADADRVRRQLDTVSARAAEELIQRAWTSDVDHVERWDDDSWHTRTLADRQGLDAGLLIGEDGSWAARSFMPAEVALALRGPDYRLPFHPDPPPVTRLPVSRLAADVQVAVSAFDASATAVLDSVSVTPLAAVQAGGIGSREITRVARSTRVPETTVRLVVELAAHAGLLAHGRPVAVADSFAGWRESEAAQRYVVLATAWWSFLGRASRAREPDGSAHRALTGTPCEPCRAALHGIVDVTAPDAGISLPDAAQLATWRHPTAHAGDPPFAEAWAEAELMGAVSQGARTAVGSALLAGDEAALLAAVVDALPASSNTAVFGSDLTAFVAGSPAARVSVLLDSCADRESGGGAVTWRLSPASVRRFLDSGSSVADLLSRLTSICAGGTLPQAVTVLLADVGRAYGRVQVTSAVTVLVGDDEVAAAEVLHDRRLASLGLRPVTPTVLVSDAPADKLVKALRKAGHMPAWSEEQASEPVVVRRAVPRRRGPSLADPAALAAALLAAPSFVAVSSVEDDVRHDATELSDDEVHVLAAAIEERSPVGIIYEASTGGITERVITPREYLRGRIWAWCALRSDEREFAVSRVLAVHAV